MRLSLTLAALLLAGPALAVPYVHSGMFTDGGSGEGVDIDTFGSNYFPLDRGVLSLSFTTSRPLSPESLSFYAFQFTGYVDIDTTTGEVVDAASQEYPTYFFPERSVTTGSLLLKLPPNTVSMVPFTAFYPDIVLEYRGYDAFIHFDATLAPGDAPVDYTFRVDKIADVPEPATWALLVAGFGGVGAVLRRRPRIAMA